MLSVRDLSASSNCNRAHQCRVSNAWIATPCSHRARGRGVNPLVYWLARGVLQPFFHLYFRLSRIGREHIPAEGPFIFASNHRSFLDPFVIGMMARRPLYFLTKKEAFINRPAAWLLSSLGAYPIDRGSSDQEAMATTRAILERGDGVLIFPEGTRTRPGPLGAAEARHRPPGARDRRARHPGGDHRLGGRAQGLAHPPAQGAHPRRARR